MSSQQQQPSSQKSSANLISPWPRHRIILGSSLTLLLQDRFQTDVQNTLTSGYLTSTIMLPDNEGKNSGVESEAQKELGLLNRSMIDKMTQIVNDNTPASDLWPQIRLALSDYRKTKTEVLKSQNLNPEPPGEYTRGIIANNQC